MFERFSDRSRLVVVHAQEEARALHHSHIGTEHLLLALVRDHHGLGAIILESMGATEDRVRERLRHYMAAGHRPETESGHIPFTPRVKRVLELGLREALQLGHDFIGTEHLLLALIKEADGLAGQTLRDLGVRLDEAREQVIARHPPELGPSPVSPGAHPLRAEVESLRAEVARLRDLLRRHGIDPDEHSGPEDGPEDDPGAGSESAP